MRSLLIVFVALALSSCFEKGDCVVKNTNLVRINLKNKSDNSVHNIVLTSVEVNGVKAVPKDTITPINALQLPVDPTKTETTFVLHYGEEKKLVFDYTNQTLIPSADCGAAVYQFDVNVKETTYDPASIKKINDKLLTNATVNFEIYF